MRKQRVPHQVGICYNRRRNTKFLREWAGEFSHTAQMFLLNEIENTALYWYVRGGGSPEDFEREYNELKRNLEIQ